MPMINVFAPKGALTRAQVEGDHPQRAPVPGID